MQENARLERAFAENQTTSNGKAGSKSPPNHPGDQALAYTEAAAGATGAAAQRSKITHEQLPSPQNLAPQLAHETETEQAAEAGEANDAADPSALPQVQVNVCA